MNGKFLPDTPSEGYNQVSVGGGHKAKTADKFCGPTKGNKDLPPNMTDRTPQGSYSGK